MGSFKREGARMMTTTRPQPRYALDEREATMCRIADDMEREHPAWMVMYGVACRQFLGFPRFKSGWIVAPDPVSLVALMAREEQQFVMERDRLRVG